MTPNVIKPAVAHATARENRLNSRFRPATNNAARMGDEDAVTVLGVCDGIPTACGGSLLRRRSLVGSGSPGVGPEIFSVRYTLRRTAYL
jgi:hypothetical protein